MIYDDSERTEQRFEALRCYCHESALYPGDNFNCNIDRDQKCLTLRPEHRSHRGGLAHVGEYYDVCIDEHELRIMFVGDDFGNASAGLEERRDSIQNYKLPLNPHYRGIVKVLIEIFQEPYEAEESTWRSLLKRMAQTNATRCAVSSNGKMGVNTTDRMRALCWPHFRKEIEILKPTIILFHGARLKEPFYKCVKKGRLSVNDIDGGQCASNAVRKALDDHCKQITWTNFPQPFSSSLLFFNHPSYGHFGRQWEPAVMPVLQGLREIGKLPTTDPRWQPRKRLDWPRI